MVLNATVQILREADDLKEKITKFKSGTSLLEDRSLWAFQQQLQQLYQKILVLDLDYALDKKVEQDLWNLGFKQQIEALQAISKDKKNPHRSEGQAMLSLVLQAAAGFYLCLLHQICTTFKLDLPFRRRASMIGVVEGWGAAGTGLGVPPPAAARYICQHCLVHLGDLARYTQQMRVAHSFYRQAVSVWAHSGQPYNQLALVAWRRGRRLCALYWHVRSALARAPFPPAPANLARTLAAAAAQANSNADGCDMPVLPGITKPEKEPSKALPSRIDATMYTSQLIRAVHLIHNVEQLDTASALVDLLNSSLSVLVTTDSFESTTLIKMACLIIWLVHASTEQLRVSEAQMSADEALAARLANALAAGSLLALMLPAIPAPSPPLKPLPALKVWMQWVACEPRAVRSAAWAARPQLWPALAHVLNSLAADDGRERDLSQYDHIPLPEDEELHGFLPIEGALSSLRFADGAAWDTYGGRLPQSDTEDDVDRWQKHATSAECFGGDRELECRVRVRRLLHFGTRLADLMPEHLLYTTEEDGSVKFSAPSMAAEQLERALAELSLASRDHQPSEEAESEDGDEEIVAPLTPVVISEADFREKFREKRIGILKPQGSLERSREERALASTQDEEEEVNEESGKGEDRKDSRKPRVNIAMAAIMRKQEETNKQVKFITPPPTPDSSTNTDASSDHEKPKVIQPKVIKSLADLPLGKKTGGILSLKDKSAGYPHLVNVEPEKKIEKEESKSNPTPYQKPHNNTSIENQKVVFPKSYSLHHQSASGLRLSVVNPKEIDVRTAALQKQNSQHEIFQEGHKFSGYHMSDDKKNFLNDLPPRFANQYRYWQLAQDNQINENKFRDESVKPNQVNANWNAPTLGNFQPSSQWWKPDIAPNFNPQNFTPPQLNPPPYYQPLTTNINYPNVQYPVYQMSKMENSGFQTAPQVNPLQNPTISSVNYGSYSPMMGYDSNMYPQFSKMGYLQQKPAESYHGVEDLKSRLSYPTNSLNIQQRVNVNLNQPLNNEMAAERNVDPMRMGGSVGSDIPNAYSLFSGAREACQWADPLRPNTQSLWSGPGPSPLERLLEQQKQIKQQPPPNN